jgi:AcrR family transcriptional regulator
MGQSSPLGRRPALKDIPGRAAAQVRKRISPPPQRRTQEQRRAETRERLIVVAIECIERFGYIEATTSLIVKHAAVSRGALQYHFPAKSDLIIAVIDRIATLLNFRFDLAQLASESLEVRVAAIIDQYWAVFMGPPFRAALNIHLGITGDPELCERLGRSLEKARTGYAAVWRGVFHDVKLSDKELSAVRRLVMSAARGFAVLRILQRDLEELDDDRKHLYEVALRELRRIQR